MTPDIYLFFSTEEPVTAISRIEKKNILPYFFIKQPRPYLKSPRFLYSLQNPSPWSPDFDSLPTPVHARYNTQVIFKHLCWYVTVHYLNIPRSAYGTLFKIQSQKQGCVIHHLALDSISTVIFYHFFPLQQFGDFPSGPNYTNTFPAKSLVPFGPCAWVMYTPQSKWMPYTTALTKCHKLGGLTTGIDSLIHSAGQKSKIHVQTGLFLALAVGEDPFSFLAFSGLWHSYFVHVSFQFLPLLSHDCLVFSLSVSILFFFISTPVILDSIPP